MTVILHLRSGLDPNLDLKLKTMYAYKNLSIYFFITHIPISYSSKNSHMKFILELFRKR